MKAYEQETAIPSYIREGAFRSATLVKRTVTTKRIR